MAKSINFFLAFFFIIFSTAVCGPVDENGKNGLINKEDDGDKLDDEHPLNYWSGVVKNKHELQVLVEQAREYADSIKHYEWTYASQHYGKPDFKPIAPMTLFPSKFPRQLFDLAQAVQPGMNLLYFRASLDFEFLINNFSEMAKSDLYIGNLLKILKETKEEGYRQQIAVQLQRSDYMTHLEKTGDDQEIQLKQIEVNVGGGGGPPMAKRGTKVHRKTLTQLGLDASVEVLRDNQPYTTYAEALYNGWRSFGDEDAIMVILAGLLRKGEHGGKKTQWDLEEQLARLSGGRLKYIAMSIEQANERLYLDPKDFSLRVKKDDRKVALVFHRYPMDPNDPAEWNARTFIERSTAVKAPTIGMELLGTKKGQQLLAMPGVAEKFLTSPDEAHYVDSIRQTFAGLWGLDQKGAEVEAVKQDAIEHPEKYVMKPMKEGGGHNFFDQTLVDNLKNFSPKELAAHILMQKILPMAVPNYFVRPCEEPQFVMAASELGVFGGLVGNVQDGTVLYNHAHGYLVRSKGVKSNEGGVLSGNGAYDSAYLY